MKFPRNDYKTARKIGLPIFCLWIANTIVLLGSLILKALPALYYSAIMEAVFSVPLYFIISRNPVPEEELTK